MGPKGPKVAVLNLGAVMDYGCQYHATIAEPLNLFARKTEVSKDLPNFSAIVYIAVRIYIMFDYVNHNIGFFP